MRMSCRSALELDIEDERSMVDEGARVDGN